MEQLYEKESKGDLFGPRLSLGITDAQRQGAVEVQDGRFLIRIYTSAFPSPSGFPFADFFRLAGPRPIHRRPMKGKYHRHQRLFVVALRVIDDVRTIQAAYVDREGQPRMKPPSALSPEIGGYIPMCLSQAAK